MFNARKHCIIVTTGLTLAALTAVAGEAPTTAAAAPPPAVAAANPADRPPPGTLAAAIRGYLDFYPPPKPPVPFWAFTWDPPATATLKRKPDDDVKRTIAGSSQSFSRAEVLDAFNVTDWHPEGHAPAPDVVMHGRKPQPVACAFCHLPNGAGMPENAPLAGLPVEYFLRQVKDFRNKVRGTMDMRMASWHGMSEYITPPLRDDEARIAAEYYSRLRLKPYLKVIETATVPKVHSIQYTLQPVPEGGSEPIGNRIIETPANLEKFDLLDSEVGYLVYVPKGSIRKGEALVTTGGNGKTLPCTACHGTDLRGMGDIPPIAGRSPSSLARQIYNIKYGARNTPEVVLMKPVVRNLSDTDIVNILAYVASREP